MVFLLILKFSCDSGAKINGRCMLLLLLLNPVSVSALVIGNHWGRECLCCIIFAMLILNLPSKSTELNYQLNGAIKWTLQGLVQFYFSQILMFM